MAITNYIDVTVQLAALPPSEPNFNNILLLTDLSSSGATPWAGAYTAELTPASWQTTLATLGYTSSDATYAMAEVLFGQDGGAGAPDLVILGRYADASWVAQVTTITVTLAAAGAWVVSINGQEVTYTAGGGDTAGQIRDGIKTAIDAATFGILDPTTANNGGAAVDLTSPTAGAAFVVTVTPPGVGTATVSTGTANTGIAADLALIEAERSDWYHILADYHVPGLVLTLAGVADAYSRPVHYAGRVHTATVQTTAIGSANDLAWRLESQENGRTSLWFDPAVGSYPDAAAAGFAAPYAPGTRTWHFCRVTGLDGFVPSSVTNLEAKRANYVELIAGSKYTINGWLGDSNYIDARIAADHLTSKVTTALLQRLSADPGVPFSDRGFEALRSLIGSTIQAQPYVDPNVDVAVTVPLKSSLSGGDLTLRRLSGVTFTATLQGFTHRVVVTGKLV